MYTVLEFAELAFKHVGIEIEWSSKGIEEMGINIAMREVIVEVNPT